MSDTQSLNSEDSAHPPSGGGGHAFVEIESVGRLSLAEPGSAVPLSNGGLKKVTLIDGLLVALLEDGTLLVGDVRPDRTSLDWSLEGRLSCLLPVASPQTGGRYLDLTLVKSPPQVNGSLVLVLLGERKNKERFMATHSLSFSGRSYVVGDELSCYDKSNVLGKGISQLASAGDQDSVFTVSNLVRKIRVEGSDSILRPTTARAQVPNDCLDGTLSLCAVSSSNAGKKGTTGKAVNLVVLATKTKSAGKNKFAIEWYACNRKDELSLIKGSSLRLHEDSEPMAILSDPRDSRSVFVIYNHRASKTSSLIKMTKTSASGAIHQFDFLVATAVMGFVNESLTIGLLPESAVPNPVLHLYVVHKTDGHRGSHKLCADCRGLQLLQSPAHLISMASGKWRLSDLTVDNCLSGPESVALSSLCTENDRLVLEPESGLPYRVRVVSCPLRGLSPETILLEDLDRCFEADYAQLSNYHLKICLSTTPSSASLSLLASWLKADKLSTVEVFYVRNEEASYREPQSPLNRLTLRTILPEKFRFLVTDTDWTSLLNQRPSTALTESVCDGGTFTLDPLSIAAEAAKSNGAPRPMSASVCSNTSSRSPFNSRIPMPKSSTVMNSSLVSNQSCHTEESTGEDLEEANQRLRGLVQRLTATLATILDVDVALRNNLMAMHELVTEVQEEIRS